ncbi:MAG: PAS domain-containing protein [Candidatus Brocadiaceae bacterium]|nr:PAS domain-containing protein [Candidatus Brocadiaceae bacterium]
MGEQTEKDKLETLQQTVKFFDNLLASLIDGVVITDELHNIIVVNDAFCNLLGRHRQEVIETNLFVWLDLLNAGIPPLWTEMTRRLYHEGSCQDVEFQVTTTHGMKYLSANASLLKSNITGKVCLIGIWRDITERKMSEERYKTIIHTSMDGFWLMDWEGRLLDINDAYCRLTGYTRDELLTMLWQTGNFLHSSAMSPNVSGLRIL